MANQWFKFYGPEYLSDTKIRMLSAAERSCWVTLLCYASVEDDNGKVKYLDTDLLLAQSGVKRDEYFNETIKDVLKTFQKLDMITVDNGMITVKNWKKRQEVHSPEYERLKRWREKKRTDNVLDNGKNREEENREEENRTTEVPSDEQNLIVPVIKAFEAVDPKNKTYYGNPTQRKAALFLVVEYGLDEVLKRIAVLPKTNKIQFFPTITTPVQLRDKWVQLQDAVDRKRGEMKGKTKIAFS